MLSPPAATQRGEKVCGERVVLGYLISDPFDWLVRTISFQVCQSQTEELLAQMGLEKLSGAYLFGMRTWQEVFQCKGLISSTESHTPFNTFIRKFRLFQPSYYFSNLPKCIQGQ